MATFGNNKVAVGKYVDPFENASKALGDWQNRILTEQQMKAKQDQLALDNKRADAQLAIQQDAADRAANTYQLGLDKQKAISDAYNVQKNVTSGQPGQDRFEAYANIVGATPEYDKAVAELDVSGVTGSARNAQIDNLRDFYSEEINAASAINSPKLEDLSNKYSVVNEASGYDGLKSTIADNNYQQRVFDNLMATGLMTATEADAQSKIQSALTKTDPLSKEAIAQRKAMADSLKDAEKNELDILKASSEKMKLSGRSTNGSGSDSKGQYNPDFEKVIKDSGFGASSALLGDWGKSPNAVRQLGLDVASELKAGNAGSPTKGQMGRALIMSQTGAPDKWLSNDANVAKAAFKESLLKVMKEDLLYGSPDSKSSTGATTTSKYGADYKSGAEAIMNKYANLRNQLNAGAQGGQQLKGTGLTELEATYSNLDKPNSIVEDVNGTPDTTIKTVGSKSVPQADIDKAIKNAESIDTKTLQEIQRSGPKDKTGIALEHQYTTDVNGNPLPEGYVRVMNNYYKVTDSSKSAGNKHATTKNSTPVKNTTVPLHSQYNGDTSRVPQTFSELIGLPEGTNISDIVPTGMKSGETPNTIGEMLYGKGNRLDKFLDSLPSFRAPSNADRNAQAKAQYEKQQAEKELVALSKKDKLKNSEQERIKKLQELVAKHQARIDSY